MAKQETALQFDLYSLSDRFPIARSLAAVALVGAVLAPPVTETNITVLAEATITHHLAAEQE